MDALTAQPLQVHALALTVGGVGMAILLGWLCVSVNMERACSKQDTPYLDICPVPARGSPAHLAALRSAISANPGDANAYVDLALADRSSLQAGLRAAAAKVAPNHPSVLMARAVAALVRQDWGDAVAPLVQLVEHRDNVQAAQLLARLVAGGQSQVMYPYLTPGTHWVPKVLAQMPQPQFALSAALPLIVQAAKVGVVDADAVRIYVRQLKSSGAWVDAYSLWLARQGKAMSVLNNQSFDEPFQPDGFDWEITSSGPPSRAGAIVERKGTEARGTVLDVRFTGRAIGLPMVRQYLFLGEGRYRLRGDYMTRQLRMEQGLAWAVQCTAASMQAGRSAALADTGGSWSPFAFEFSVPRGCGPVASLQLETFAPSDAVLGARGRAAFDAFSLEKLPS